MKRTKPATDDDLLPEYDLTILLETAARGKYAERYRVGKNLVLVDADIFREFRTEKEVNEALRLVLELRKIGVDQRPAS